MARRIVWTEQAKADIRSIEQPIAIQILKTLGPFCTYGRGRDQATQRRHPAHDPPARQDHRIFFREHGDYFQIERVLDRKEAYR
ncbi:MAG TPA: hypothetical protein VLT57_05405 [Bryobacteraceae bacterium]|nr:hypothetical protein [Bryobacteraceae bacterium]